MGINESYKTRVQKKKLERIQFIRIHAESSLPSVYPEMTYDVMVKVWTFMYGYSPYKCYKDFLNSKNYYINTGVI